VEVSIQAVSPALILSALMRVGPVGESAHATGSTSVNTARKASIGSFFIPIPRDLDSARVALARSDAHDLHQVKDKDFSIPHFSGSGRLDNGLDHLIEERIINRDFYFCLRYELDSILSAAINLSVATLPAEASNLRDGDALNANVADRLSNLFELERFDYRGNELQPTAPPVASTGRQAPLVPVLKS